MRQQLAYSLALLVWVLATRLAWAEESSETVADCIGLVRFEVLLGRITALQPRCTRSRWASQEDAAKGVRRAISLSAHRQLASLQYEYSDPTCQVVIEIQDGNRLSCRSEPRAAADTAAVFFEQPANGPVRLEIQRDGKTESHSAPTLWHLLLAEPRASRQHLLPILEHLRPNWHLDVQAQRIEETLLRNATENRQPDPVDLERLVAQLAAHDFQTRQVADRQLRRAGFWALSTLQRVNPEALDGEQQARVRGILAGLELEAGDTPHRVAHWLADDPRTWRILETHDEPRCREIATLRLAKLK